MVLGNSEYGGGVTVFKGGYFIDLKSAIAKCMLCHGGKGIAGVVVLVMMIVWY